VGVVEYAQRLHIGGAEEGSYRDGHVVSEQRDEYLRGVVEDFYLRCPVEFIAARSVLESGGQLKITLAVCD